MVRNDVDDRADPEGAGLGDQLLRFPEGPESGINRAVVNDVVAGVGQWRRIPRVEPKRVNAKRGQIRQVRPDSRQIPRAVAVGVGKAPNVDLVHDRIAPPGAFDRTLRFGQLGSRLLRIRLHHRAKNDTIDRRMQDSNMNLHL